MSNTLPVSIAMGALPASGKWTPQQLADLMVARMSLITSATFALFVTGSTEPSSDVGPWLKNGNEWWVWNATSGDYQPIEINQASLGYFIGSAAPNPLVYQFWIETTAGGSPLAVKIFYSGAWVDVYAATLASYQTIAAYTASIANYSTTAQMTAAIAAAIAGIPSVSIVAGTQIFKAHASAPVNVVFGGGGTQTGVTTLDVEDYDPDACFAASRFTAQVTGYYSFKAVMQCGVTAGSPTDFDANVTFGVNGGSEDSLNNEADNASIIGRVLTGAADYYLAVNDYVELLYSFTLNAAGTVEINDQYTRLMGYRMR